MQSDPLERELQRSRRFGRPMSLVRASSREGEEPAALANALRAAAREVDHVWPIGRDVVILLAEADAVAARAFVGRVCGPIAGLLAGQPSTATFPDDGLTRPALLATLHGVPRERVEAPAVAAPEDDGARRVPVLAGVGDRDRGQDDARDWRRHAG